MMYVDMRCVGVNVHRAVPAVTGSATGVGELETTSQSSGAVIVKAKVALRSGWSKQANMRRASITSNWV